MAEAQVGVDFLTAHARATPDKIAAIDDRPDGSVQALTFAELEERAAARTCAQQQGVWATHPVRDPSLPAQTRDSDVAVF